jgi:hypothetical protein
MRNDDITAKIRTLVPAIVGAALAWLAAKFNIVIDEQSTVEGVAFFTALCIGAYHSAVTWVSKKVPVVGWLLGSPKNPSY